MAKWKNRRKVLAEIRRLHPGRRNALPLNTPEGSKQFLVNHCADLRNSFGPPRGVIPICPCAKKPMKY